MSAGKAHAGVSCVASVIPFPTAKAKQIGIMTAAFGEGAIALISDVGKQYDSLNKDLSFLDKLKQINWSQSFRQAGSQALIAGISTGVTVYAASHPKFINFSEKVKKLSYEQIEKLLKKSGFSSKTADEFCRRFGVRKALGQYARLTGALKSTYDDIIRIGGKAVENNGVLKLFSKNGTEIAQVSNGKILPTKYFDKASHSGATALGQPANGYQVFKKGDDLVVKRIPDQSAYSSSELKELTQHPNAHVLERHGHDVTEEALIKRANTGIAPDGSISSSSSSSSVNSPDKPPYSSKFESPQQVQQALINTRPGTPAFNSAPITKQNTKIVEHELTDGTTYGKGVPKETDTFHPSVKVRAIYRQMSPNNWQLLTMYPDFKYEF